MGELLELHKSFKETKTNIINREARKFNSNERKKLYKNCINKFSYMIDMVLFEYAKKILDPTIPTLPGIVSNENLKSYRTFYFNTPNIDLDIFERSLKYKNNSIVRNAMVEAQHRSLMEQVKENGPIDLDTPITDLYMSKEAYDFFDELGQKFEREMTLRYMVGCYLLFYTRHVRLKNMPIAEIILIVESCGYDREYKLPNGEIAQNKR